PGLLHVRFVLGRKRSEVRRTGAELEVETGFDDVFLLLNVDAGRTRKGAAKARRRYACERNCLGAEVIIIVLHEAGEPVSESVFAAETNSPAPTRAVACGQKRNRSRGRYGVVVIFPGPAALHVTEDA